MVALSPFRPAGWPMRLRPAVLAGVLFSSLSGQAQNPTPASLDAALQAAVPGDVVSLDGAGGNLYLNRNPNQLALVPGTLIYSDDPETPTAHGVLYRDTVPAGPARVYLYHVNGMAAPARITAVLENAGTTPATVRFERKSLAGPSGDYITVGKRGVQRYYENTSLPADLSLAPGAAALLDPALDALSASFNQLVSAKYDFVSDQPVTVTTLLLPAAGSTLATFKSQSVLPGDGSNRQGTFSSWGKENPTPWTYSTADQVRVIRIGDGAADNDPFVAGTDVERGTATTLRGNFGVTYRIRLQVSSPDGRRLAVLLNPRGGNYGGYVRSTFPETGTAEGQLLPSSVLVLGDTTKAVVCAKITPSTGAQTLLLELIPAGASNLPIHLLLVPYGTPASVADWSVY